MLFIMLASIHLDIRFLLICYNNINVERALRTDRVFAAREHYSIILFWRIQNSCLSRTRVFAAHSSGLDAVLDCFVSAFLIFTLINTETITMNLRKCALIFFYIHQFCFNQYTEKPQPESCISAVWIDPNRK